MGARLNRALQALTLGPVPALQCAPEPAGPVEGCGGGFAPAHRDKEADAAPAARQAFDVPRLKLDDIVAEHVRDGIDYTRICARPGHEWASSPLVSRASAERLRCPFCEAERGGGRERYWQLLARLAGGSGHG